MTGERTSSADVCFISPSMAGAEVAHTSPSMAGDMLRAHAGDLH
jgi:hypothetical protein